MTGLLRLHARLARTLAVAAAAYAVLVLAHGGFGAFSPGSAVWIAAGALYTHFFEYFHHRVLMHAGVRGLTFVKRQHLEHHRIFDGDRFRSRDPRDLVAVASHWAAFPALLALHYAAFLAVLPRAAAPWFFLGVTAHYFLYETLHWFTHIEDNLLDRVLARIPLLGRIRAWQMRHHRIHHGEPIVNFNFTPPYAGDRTARTYQM